MKKILITGANSYIGTSFERWMGQYDGYEISTLDMIGDQWRSCDFSQYDAVFHVAGIAHIKETEENAPLYYKVNRDLAIETAKRAKESGVKHFVLLSSMSVYGKTAGVIKKDTHPEPKSNYGKSKLEADEAITAMAGDTFLVAILRPPMVYGEGCKGNYQLLKKFALKSPIFPDFENKRSMVEISVLCEFVKKVIDEESTGYFFPQNKEYICTSRMVGDIAKENGKKIVFTKIFNPFIRAFKNVSVISKVFGDLIYDIDE